MLENLVNIGALRIVIPCLLVSYHLNKETADYKFRLARLPLEAIEALRRGILTIYIASSRRRARTLIIPSYFINSILITILEGRVQLLIILTITL